MEYRIYEGCEKSSYKMHKKVHCRFAIKKNVRDVDAELGEETDAFIILDPIENFILFEFKHLLDRSFEK
jgi:hypothetical protein